jgi:ferredoxin
VKVLLDSGRCQGHGRCYDLAPEVFGEDDEGYARVHGDGVVLPDAERVATLAAKNCPENAIDLIQDNALQGATS